MSTLHVSRRTPSGRTLVQNLAATVMDGRSERTALARGELNGVKYAVGGWSSTARGDLLGWAVDYCVMLVFTWRHSGAYLDGLRIAVCDASGKNLLVLDGSGPIVLLDLPPGIYRLEVGREGEAGLTRSLVIGLPRRRQAVFYWDDDKDPCIAPRARN